MFKRILVGYDGSKGAEGALRKAVELAKVCHAQVLVLTVYRHHSLLEASFSMVRPQEPENMDDLMRGHATEVADYGKKVAREAGAENVRAFVKAGQPSRSIIAFAREHDVDLIAVGCRGLGSIEGYMVGSVSHKITGLADRPVLVV
ncbi:universal stress protein [Roseitranquillus sediminis]|uniref:universal stress protein n=1 Tax=Roseitranquillus sediminis TaxID=2809051 RepID=UPI001D0C93CA|nr:universal stress protein [Roseitranquillus sediminis]MBM9593952.1 universal stress protein [Roseitranquillus sediminis]